MAGFDSRRPPTEEVMGNASPLRWNCPDCGKSHPPVNRGCDCHAHDLALQAIEIAELKAVVLAQNAKVDCYREQNNGMLYCCDELEKKVAKLEEKNRKLKLTLEQVGSLTGQAIACLDKYQGR